MTTDEKLAAILAAVQTDPGNRGLARDPQDNLFTATKGDFEKACWSIAQPGSALHVVTGFIIPSVDPPCFETDGPLGAVCLVQSLIELHGFSIVCSVDPGCAAALAAGLDAAGILPNRVMHVIGQSDPGQTLLKPEQASHVIALERPGSAANGRLHTMRGRDITELMQPADHFFDPDEMPRTRSVRSDTFPTYSLLDAVQNGRRAITIGIGDGGNEIGMGKIKHETLVKNILSGDLIHCRVPTDHLIVCGVSNWGAYALAAGVYAIRQAKPPALPTDPDRERKILEAMVREGPLVDGVTGQQTATVDGLTWDEYAKPLVRIREILES